MITNNKSIVVTAGYQCNSNCEMCVVGSNFQNGNNSTTEEIFRILVEGIKKNAKRVEFSGGEPTVRKDLPQLISLAKNVGYTEIGISTNGMLLSNKKYCDDLIRAGLNSITFSLHATNQLTNETITNTPHSFNRTIAGIKNATSNELVEVSVVTAVQKSNFEQLVNIGNLIYSLGVKNWNICDLVPVGMAKEKYASLSINRIDLFKTLKTITPLLSKMYIMLFNFTQCSVPKDFPEKDVMTISRKSEETNFISYDKKEEFKKSTINDGTVNKIEICKSCIFSDKCGGFWSEYFRLYGEKDIIELATKNSCLK